jgi:hypothetical protein
MSLFEQASIKVERTRELEELKGSITRVFAPQKVQKFLERLQSKGIRIRDWDAILAQQALDREDEALAKSGSSAQALYQALSMSDQAQMREFYLSRIEEVDEALRHRFKRIYQYY